MTKTASLCILALFLVLGCLTETSRGNLPVRPSDAVVEYGHGIKINYFQPDFEEIYSSEVFTISMDLLNVGNAKASQIGPRLSLPGGFSLQAGPRGAPSDMDPPDVTNNFPGDAALVFWEVLAPSDISTREHEIRGIVTYNYISEGRADFVMLTRQRLYEHRKQSTEPQGTSASSSAGPVSVEIVVPQSQIVVSKDETGSYSERIVPITINIKDVGTGVVKAIDKGTGCHDELGCIDKVTIRMTKPNPQYYALMECNDVLATSSGSEYVVDIPKLQMVGAETGYVTCNLNVTLPDDVDPSFERLYSAYAIASYNYQIEGKTNIKVVGTGGLAPS
ncbi:MAG: hypothetical protein ABH829_03865 [archaeon]